MAAWALLLLGARPGPLGDPSSSLDSSCREGRPGCGSTWGAAPHPRHPAGIQHCRRLLCQQGEGNAGRRTSVSKGKDGGCWTQRVPSLGCEAAATAGRPWGVGEWQQEGLPLWVDLCEGGAAGRGRRDHQRGSLAAVGEEWVVGVEGRACRTPAVVRAQPGLTWTSCLCLSLSLEVAGGQLGTGVCVCVCARICVYVGGVGWWGGGGMWVGSHLGPGGPGRGASEARAGGLAGLLFSPTEELAATAAGIFRALPPDWFFLALMFHVWAHPDTACSPSVGSPAPTPF